MDTYGATFLVLEHTGAVICLAHPVSRFRRAITVCCTGESGRTTAVGSVEGAQAGTLENASLETERLAAGFSQLAAIALFIIVNYLVAAGADACHGGRSGTARRRVCAAFFNALGRLGTAIQGWTIIAGEDDIVIGVDSLAIGVVWYIVQDITGELRVALPHYIVWVGLLIIFAGVVIVRISIPKDTQNEALLENKQEE